jgi:hypothetical protein
VYVLDHVVHYHRVKLLVVKPRLIERPAKNWNSKDAAGAVRSIFIYLLPLHVPSSSSQLRQPSPVAATYFENSPGRQSAQVHKF